jgi:hypothetical protein
MGNCIPENLLALYLQASSSIGRIGPIEILFVLVVIGVIVWLILARRKKPVFSSSKNSAAPEANALVKRYWDAYLVANSVDRIGNVVKGIGVVIGFIIGITVMNMGQGSNGTAAGIAFGFIVFLVFYIFGVFISAQAQVLKATLDGAVNTSPFLTNEQKASVMKLK